eukprot:scaffold32950_cov66-Attheya_sp.AAC.3
MCNIYTQHLSIHVPDIGTPPLANVDRIAATNDVDCLNFPGDRGNEIVIFGALSTIFPWYAIPKREKRARFTCNPVTEVHHLPAEGKSESMISEDPSFKGMDILLEENLEDVFLSKKPFGLCDELEALLELDLNNL